MEEPPKKKPPPPPPPSAKRLERPKITLQIPQPNSPMPSGPRTGNTVYWAPGPLNYQARPPGTAGTQHSNPQMHPYINPFQHMYHNKASDFMFKQFEGFKDFTMNTAKSGLSAGEKSAFWFVNRLRSLSKKWFTHFFLTLCLMLYSLMGAGIFMALEGPHEKNTKNVTTVRQEMVVKLEDLFAKNRYNISVNLYADIDNTLAEYETIYSDSVKGNKTWTFFNAMFYAGTIYTTIGYGHIAPKTFYGRVATIVYAVIGIPLFLIVLADFGKLFTRIIKFFWAFIRRFYYTRSCRKVRRTGPMQEMMKGFNIVYDVVRRPSQIFNEEDLAVERANGDPPALGRKPSDVPPPLPPKPGTVVDYPEPGTEPETPAPSLFEIDDEFNLPITVAIVILVIYILIGAFAYSIWESWNFFESFYFVFISMSTIGLGDLVPEHPMYMMASILYLVFGLALTSMCINVVQEKLSDTFKKASTKIGATIGLQVAEEDGSLVTMPPDQTEVAPVHKKIDSSESKDTDENDEKNS